jgi:hypothetical protein
LMMSLTPPPTVQKLREALHAKAKKAPNVKGSIRHAPPATTCLLAKNRRAEHAG